MRQVATQLGPPVPPTLHVMARDRAASGDSRPQAGQATSNDADPWASDDPGGYSDEPPF